MRNRCVCLVFGLVAGCSSPGSLVSRAGGGAPAEIGKAPVDGAYELFIAGESEPQWGPITLKAGQPLGFESVTGENPLQIKITYFFAVAGNERRPLDLRKVNEWRRL